MCKSMYLHKLSLPVHEIETIMILELLMYLLKLLQCFSLPI